MKKTERMWKRFLAIGLAFAVAIQCFGGLTLVSKAMETRDDYKELTYSDLSGTQFAGVDGTSLNGCAFNANVTFGAADAYFRIGGADDVGGWKATLQVQFKENLNGNGPALYFRWSDDNDKSVSTNAIYSSGFAAGKTMKIRMEFDVVNTTDVQVKMYIDNKLQKTMTFTGTADYFGRYLVSSNVTFESVKEYYEFTFSDAGVTDTTTNKQGMISQFDSVDEKAFRGKVTYLERVNTNTDASPWDDCFYFAVDDYWSYANGVYIYYHHTQNKLYVRTDSVYTSFSMSSIADTLLGRTVEYYITFNVEADVTRIGVSINGTKIGEVTSSVAPGLGINAYSKNGTMTIADADVVPEFTNVVGYEDFTGFGVAPQEITYSTTKGVLAPANGMTTFDGYAFEDYMTFCANSDQKAFLYMGVQSGDTWKGVRLYQTATDTTVQYHGKDAGGSTKLTFIASGKNELYGITNGEQFKIKIGVEYYYTQDIGVFVWINDIYAGRGLVVGEAQSMSNSIDVKVTADGYSMTCGKKVEISYDDFTRLTPKDFGYPDFIFKPGTHGNESTAHTTKALSADSTLADLNETYLDVDLTCTGTGGSDYLVYATNGGWNGICVRWRNSGLQIFSTYTGGEVYGGADSSQTGIVEGETFNLKLYTMIDGTTMTAKAVVTSATKTYEIDNMTFTSMDAAANQLAVYTASGTIEMATPVTEIKEVGPYSYDLADGNYLVVKKDATINGEVVTVGSEISTPGEYVLTYPLNGVTIKEKVILYLVGDVNLNGTAGEAADQAALESMLSEGTNVQATSVAQLGADLDNDNLVGNADLELLKSITGGRATLADIKAKYYVPAVSYDYLGGDEVMPIVGYYGPFKTSNGNFISDEVMELVKDSGVNMVNFTQNYWGSPYTNLNVLNEIEQYTKHGIGYFTNHYNWITDTTIDEQIAAMSQYANYGAVIGSHLTDEPKADTIANWYELSAYLNKYTNTNGFINLVPEDNPSVSDSYDTYWSNYVANANPKVLSVDDYPFNDSADEGVTNATGYFKTLATARANAGTDRPFWYYVQAGGDFAGNWLTTNEALLPTEAETYWNVNTALAFGAKGIEWFPLLQPTAYATATDDSTNYDKNGLIGANADSDVENAKTDYYDTAVIANKQIAAVDAVLMKASSKGVIATGGYAASQTNGLVGMIDASATTKLESVTAEDTTNGALVGCFDYKDTEAYYVVNYSVDAEQDIVLAFNDKYSYRVINYNGETTANGATALLTIPAGEAVLVVMEEAFITQPSVEVYPSDFAMEDGTYTYSATSGAQIMASGTYAPVVNGTASKTLDGTVFTANVELGGNSRINLGYNNSSYYGISLMTDTRSGHEKHLMMRWEESGNNSAYSHFLNPVSVGLTSFVGVEYELKISMDVVDSDGDGAEDDLKVGVWFNDKFYANSSTEDGYIYWTDKTTNFGTTLALRADAAGSYVKIGSPKLNVKEYDAITTTDIGLPEAIYNPYSGNCAGRYNGESMDGVLFSANLDFKKSTGNYIRFAGKEGAVWNAMQFEYSDGNLYMDSKNMSSIGYVRYRVNYGEIPNEVFNLRISMDYVDFDRDGFRDDVKMGVWINDVLTNNNQYIYYIDMVSYIGNNIIFVAPHYAARTEKNPYDYTIVEEFTVLATPIEKKLAATSYNLSETKGYTVPGTSTTYAEPGEYEIAFTENGTTYSGKVSLYYEGDANMDGEIDVRDLVRIKTRTNPYKQFTFGDAGVTDATTNKQGKLADCDSMNQTAFRGKVTYLDRTDTAAASAPYNDRLYIGVSDYWSYTKDGLYIYYNHNAETVCINGTNYSIKPVAETFIGETVEYYITFDVNEDGAVATVYINKVKIAEVSLVAVSTGIHAYSANETMTIESVPIEVLTEGTALFKGNDVNNNNVLDAADSDALRSVLIGAEPEKETVFGVISDTHFFGNGGDSKRQERYRKALEYYREQGAELIIMNADLTDHGEIGGYRALVSIAEEVYKDTPAELRPQFIATADNHEYYEAWDWTEWGSGDYTDVMARFSEHLSALDTELNGTDLNSSRVINGYTFIGVSRDGSNSARATFTEETLSWLQTELAKAAALDASKPIFVAIHQPPTGSVSSSATDGTEAYHEILAAYPQVVLFSSHTHAALEDEHSLYQEEYTVVNTGSVYYVGGLGSDINGGVSFVSSSKAEIYEFAQALLVRANGTKVEIERCNFLGDTPAKIKYNWIFDVADTDNFSTYTEERADSEAPVFVTGTIATYDEATGTVSFVAATDNDFIYYYEITVDGTVYNYLTDFYQGIPQMDATCTFTLSGASADSVIEIRAVDSYGNKSDAISVN